MGNSCQAWRRWFGVLFLALAFGMLVWGQTVLQPHLDGTAYLIYWLFCFVFTFAAIFTALIDMRATRRRTQLEQQELLDKALNEIKPGEKARSAEPDQ